MVDIGEQGHAAVAATPHPRRFVQIARVRPGAESEVRYWQARFPAAAAEAAGLTAVEAFIGSGYYVVLYELCEGDTAADASDFQAVFARYMNDPAVREHHRYLARFLEDFPAPAAGYSPGDAFHTTGTATPPTRPGGSEVLSSGALQLAAGMFRWRGGTGPVGDQ